MLGNYPLGMFASLDAAHDSCNTSEYPVGNFCGCGVGRNHLVQAHDLGILNAAFRTSPRQENWSRTKLRATTTRPGSPPPSSYRRSHRLERLDTSAKDIADDGQNPQRHKSG